MQQRQTMQSKPIPLIESGSAGELILNPQAEAFFTSLGNQRFCVLGIVGKARTGKSSFLNQLLNQKAFQVTNGVSLCTRGIQISPLLREDANSPCKFIVLDTQGLGSSEAADQTDSQLFLLNMLLCSTLIYNSFGVIDQQAINSLSLVVDLGKALRHQFQAEEASSQQQSNFPQFVWLLRDFMLRLQNQYGQPISSKQYLERALEEQKGVSSNISQKNRIRRVIKGFFRQRDCQVLVRPTDSEEQLTRLTDSKQFRNDYIEAISKIKVKLMKKMTPKKIKGLPVTGRTLVNQIKRYLQAFNSGGVPRVEYIWNAVKSEQAQQIQNDLLKKIEHAVTAVSNPNQIDSTLKQLQKTIQQSAATCYLNQQTVDKIGQLARQKLQEKKKAIHTSISKNCQQIMQSAEKKLLSTANKADNQRVFQQQKQKILVECQKYDEGSRQHYILKQHILRLYNSKLRWYSDHAQNMQNQKTKANLQLSYIKKEIKFIAQKNSALEKQRTTLLRTIDSQQKHIQQLRETKPRNEITTMGPLSSHKKNFPSEQLSISGIEQSHGIGIVEKVLEMYKKLQAKHSKLQQMVGCMGKVVCAYCQGRFEVAEFERHYQQCRTDCKPENINHGTSFAGDHKTIVHVSNPSFFTPYIYIPEGVLTVQVSKTLIKEDTQQRNYVQYTLQVQLHKSRWSLNRKYRDFCQLHDLLLIMFPKMSFPASSSIMKNSLLTAAVGNSNRKQVVQQRRKMLQQYMMDMLLVGQIRNTRIVQKFLKVNKQYQQLEYIENYDKSPIKQKLVRSSNVKNSKTFQINQLNR